MNCIIRFTYLGIKQFFFQQYNLIFKNYLSLFLLVFVENRLILL